MKHCIAIIWFILLGCSQLSAQEYLYSVTTGTAWCREVFPREEKRQFDANAKSAPLENAPAFCKIFRAYEKNYRNYHNYNDSIFIPASHAEWIGMFQRRANVYSRIYAETTEQVKEINAYFKGKNVPDAAYDSLFFWMRHLYHRSINDAFLYEDAVEILLPHYQTKQDTEHLVFCYSLAGQAYHLMSRMGDKESEMRSKDSFQKVWNMNGQFCDFKDPLNRYYLISAYVNLSVLHNQLGNVSINEALEMTRCIKELCQLPQNQALVAQDSLLGAFEEWSIDLFNLRSIVNYLTSGNPQNQVLQQLYANYCKTREKFHGDMVNTKNRYYAKLNYDDLLVEAYMGHRSWLDVFDEMMYLILTDPELRTDEGAPKLKINYLKNLSVTATYLLDRVPMTEENKRKAINKWIEDYLSIIERYPHGQYSIEKGLILENTATSPFLLKYLNSQQRRDLLYRLIVVEQPTTYVHVSMVANLSRVLAKGMIENHPEFFVGVPGYATADEVVAKKDSLLEFIYQAAMHHDLGKIAMPTIVNNCFRALTDHEYSIIKEHPERAIPFLHIDSSLNEYEDIAVGHHKWYNGKGYPASFENLQSAYYPIICLITICDCMDAATENVGRNYHTPKSFEKVMQEFEADKSVRYHPVLIDFINENRQVYDEMKAIVRNGRWDEYYKLYMEYFMK